MSKDLKEGREGAIQIPGKEHSAEGRASAKALRQGMLGVLEEGPGVLEVAGARGSVGGDGAER